MPSYGYYNPGPSQTQVGTGRIAERQGLQNLLLMLQGQGRMDPRMMASMQANNARSTQQQQDAVRGRAAAGGMARGGLAQALQASIGSAGANRAANIQYQDINDAYGRNQQNLGLMNQLIQQPGLGYASLQEGRYQAQADRNERESAAKLAAFMSLIGAAGGGAAAYKG